MGVRVLCLAHPGTNSRDIFLDMVEGYREAGAETFILELQPLWQRTEQATDEIRRAVTTVFVDTVLASVKSNRIDLAVGMWANAPLALGDWSGKSFFEHFGIPIVMHWLDAPQWAHSGTLLDVPVAFLNGPYSAHIINNPATAQEMTQVLGFSNVLCLSNAASPTRFKPYPAAQKDFDIVFAVGADNTRPTDLMRSELNKDEPDIGAIRADAAEQLMPTLLEHLQPFWASELHANAFAEAMIRERLVNRDEAVLRQIARVANTHRRLAPGILSLLQDRRRYVKFTMALRRMENWERAFTFVHLSRYFRCAAFGLSEPFKDWPGKWTWLGSLPYEDQAKAYGRSWFGLNVMRWQDDEGLNLKPFEITLSGACLLQSYRCGLHAHFTPSEAVVFRTPQECRRRVAELLAESSRIEATAAAGRARSLAEHCWKHRAHQVLNQVLKSSPANRARSAAAGHDRSAEEGEGLAFVLGMWRGGTTLLRKMLDSHSLVYAPAETWFLLPLIGLWNGEGPNAQAAAAIQGHIRQEQFLECVRAFANRFYQSIRPAGARYVIDKTPLYLRIADLLPGLFPRAKFIVLGRDPRGAVWSRHTWKHVQSRAPEDHFRGAAHDLDTLARFMRQHRDRSIHISYEELCERPEDEIRRLCAFLAVPVELGMIQYGLQSHHEGYGDEKTRQHKTPHTQAIRRWEDEGGLTQAQQADLAGLCGRENLTLFGYTELASLIVSDGPNAASTPERSPANTMPATPASPAPERLRAGEPAAGRDVLQQFS